MLAAAQPVPTLSFQSPVRSPEKLTDFERAKSETNSTLAQYMTSNQESLALDSEVHRITQSFVAAQACELLHGVGQQIVSQLQVRQYCAVHLASEEQPRNTLILISHSQSRTCQ